MEASYNKKERLLNIEAFRILAMLLIIAHHIMNSEFAISDNLRAGRYLMADDSCIVALFMDGFCIIGVNCFFLLTGFFNIQFKLRKLVYLILDLYIVSGLIRLVGWGSGQYTSAHQFIMELINPFSMYWFMTVYFILMLISPFINKLLENITAHMYFALIIIILFLFDFVGWLGTFGLLGIGTGYSIVHAICMYVIGNGAAKAKNIKLFDVIHRHSLQCTFAFLTMNIVYIFFNYILFADPQRTYQVYSYNSIINVFLSLALFDCFQNIQLKNEIVLKVVACLSPHVLAVYYLHSSSWIGYYRNLPVTYFDGINKIFFLFLYVPLVFLICVTIDKIKCWFYSDYVMKFSLSIENKLYQYWTYIVSKSFV